MPPDFLAALGVPGPPREPAAADPPAAPAPATAAAAAGTAPPNSSPTPRPPPAARATAAAPPAGAAPTAPAGAGAPETGGTAASEGSGVKADDAPPGAWRIKAPEATRYKPFCVRCHQRIETGEPRLSCQAAHGKSYHIGCANIPESTMLSDLPGWCELRLARRQQATDTWNHLLSPPRKTQASERSNTTDSGMSDTVQQPAVQNRPAQAQTRDEDWIDPDNADGPEGIHPAEGVSEHNLVGMGFWATVSWDSMRQRWLPLPVIPAELQQAIMELRAAVAGTASRNGSPTDPGRIEAQKCFFLA